MYCQYCGREVIDLPFRCSFCGGYFCTEHRLPENHSCPEYLAAIMRRRERHQPVIEERISKSKHFYSLMKPKFKFGRQWFSSTEVIHLIIGAILVLLVGLSIMPQEKNYLMSPHGLVSFILQKPVMLLGSALLFTTIFVLHELSHKAVAKHYGLWAEFRLTLWGILLTSLSIISPIIKLVSPGAVIISGIADRKVIGKAAFAGPFTNIMLASLFFGLSFFFHASVSSILIWGAALSSWIALLNLIPFSVFDGAKIFWWNRLIWITSFSMSLLLTLVTMLLL
ncbi:MAG: AN1-type zinc finger domain-containing protein [Candidatus Bathyarchaeia archaeon]